MVGHCTIGRHQVCYGCHFELKYQFLDFNNDESLDNYLHTSLLIFIIKFSVAGKPMNKLEMILGDFLLAFFVYCIF